MSRKVRIQIIGMFPSLMGEEKIAVKNGVLRNPTKTQIPEN